VWRLGPEVRLPLQYGPDSSENNISALLSIMGDISYQTVLQPVADMKKDEWIVG